MPSYEVQTFHIDAAVMACMRLDRAGENAADYYMPDVHPAFPAGLDWRGLAQALNDAGEALSVDTLSDAPYRVMIGTENVADDVGWIDVEEADVEAADRPDAVVEAIG